MAKDTYEILEECLNSLQNHLKTLTYVLNSGNDNKEEKTLTTSVESMITNVDSSINSISQCYYEYKNSLVSLCKNIKTYYYDQNIRLNNRLKALDTESSIINLDIDDAKDLMLPIESLVNNVLSSFKQINNQNLLFKNNLIQENDKVNQCVSNQIQQLLDGTNSFLDEIDIHKQSYECISDSLNNFVHINHKKPKLCFNGDSSHSYEFDVDLIKKYPGCYLYELYKDPSMWMDNGDIYIDHNDDNYNSILKYMKNDESLIEQLKNMDVKKRNEFVNDLDFMSLPVKVNYMNELCFDEDRMKMEAWKKRVIMVNGKNAVSLNMYLKKNGLFENVFNKNSIENIKYYKENNIMYVNMMLKYGDFIEDYCRTKVMNFDLIKKENNINQYSILESEIKLCGILLNEKQNNNLKSKLYSSYFIRYSSIIKENQYNIILQEWFEDSSHWRLIYKASEHNYRTDSFHKYCDDKGPTLIVIKTSEGWIFGGYTTLSWKCKYPNKKKCEFKTDSNACIFTLKNPHHIPPTKFNKLSLCEYSILCSPYYGPIFGNEWFDLCIGDGYDYLKKCTVSNNGEHAYECDLIHKNSLFVNTNEITTKNSFILKELEVFSYHS